MARAVHQRDQVARRHRLLSITPIHTCGHTPKARPTIDQLVCRAPRLRRRLNARNQSRISTMAYGIDRYADRYVVGYVNRCGPHHCGPGFPTWYTVTPFGGVIGQGLPTGPLLAAYPCSTTSSCSRICRRRFPMPFWHKHSHANALAAGDCGRRHHRRCDASLAALRRPVRPHSSKYVIRSGFA